VCVERFNRITIINMDEFCPKCGDELYDNGNKFECECGFRVSCKLFLGMAQPKRKLDNQEYLSSL